MNLSQDLETVVQTAEAVKSMPERAIHLMRSAI